MFARVAGFARDSWGSLWWAGLLLLFVGVVTNFGTAALRLPALVPSPEVIDGASYYVGAWAMRLGMSPYGWSPETMHLAGREHGVMLKPPLPHSPPPWVWMYQALTVFPYPVAAWVWLLILLAVMAYSTHLLVRIAGYSAWKATLLVLPLTLTFGPTFLSLTIGQNAPVVLLGALLLGRHLRRLVSSGPAVAGWVIAVSAKIYPLLWIASLPFLKRWRIAVCLGVACVLLFGIVILLESDANRDYWFDFILRQGREVTKDVFVDDQSLGARIELLGRTNRMELHGLDVHAREEIVWSPPWEIPRSSLHVIGLIVIAGLAAVVVRTWLLADKGRFNEGLFYLVVLFSLLPIPHMERYNHVAVLPAMAWLWKWGPKYRFLTVLAYCLVGLSRLNHLWAAIFPWPLGPLATGTCMYAVLILGGGIVNMVLYSRPRPIPTLSGVRS